MIVIYGSTRDNGNTETLTKLLTKELEAEEVFLKEKTIYPIIDRRHDPNGFEHMADDYYDVLNKMMAHDQIIFATPLYWYGMSGHMKNFIDRWSESLRDTALDFKERMKAKKIYVVVVGGDNPRLKALPLIMQFQYIFEFFGSSLQHYIIGKANVPNQILEDKQAIGQAEVLNKLFLAEKKEGKVE